MKKWIETITALVMAGFLMVAMIGCGDANIEQGEVGETGADAEADTKKQEEEAAAGKEGQPPDGGGDGGKKGGDDKGGADPAGGTGGEDPNNPNP